MSTPQNDSSSDKFQDLSTVENVHLNMPASLAALSTEEYDKMGKKATLKMDMVIMPIMVTMYILNYLDRQNIASAKLGGIMEDLGLSQVEYQTTVSILFVGYSECFASPCLVSCNG